MDSCISPKRTSPRLVWPLPVRKRWAVGPKTEARLAELGASSIGEPAALPLDTLQWHFGSAHGRYRHRAARGCLQRNLPARPVRLLGIRRSRPESAGR